MIFVMTVDTEADNQWAHGAPLKTENVRYWQRFQAICDKHEILPTYLITSEIAADDLARARLEDWAAAGKAEVGAHLHPWTTPPFLEGPGLRHNDPAHAFLCELPDELIRGKIEKLTSEIEDSLGIRPTSFRAGRFGFDGRCAAVLAELGYAVDSSVTPLTEWSTHPGLPGGNGGPNFAAQEATPFIVGGSGDQGLVEIPVTIVPTYGALRRFPGLLRLYRTLPARAARRLLFRRWLCPQPVWLEPVPDFAVSDLQDAFDRQSQGSDVAVMLVHSSELMPGGGPTRPSEASVQELLELLDTFFEFVRSRGAVPLTLSRAAYELRSQGRLPWRAL